MFWSSLVLSLLLLAQNVSTVFIRSVFVENKKYRFAFLQTCRLKKRAAYHTVYVSSRDGDNGPRQQMSQTTRFSISKVSC